MRLKIKEAIDHYNKGKDFKLTMSALALLVFQDREIGDRLKIRYISDMNVGKRRVPRMDEIVKIAEILETSTDFLLGMSE